MFTKKVSEELLVKFNAGDAMRANEYIEIYLFYKNLTVSLNVLGQRFALASEAANIDFENAKLCVSERSLLSYCEDVYSKLTATEEAVSNIGVAFIVRDSSEPVSQEFLSEKITELSYVADVNFVTVGENEGIFISYSKSDVPEGEAFSTNVSAIEGILKVHKVV